MSIFEELSFLAPLLMTWQKTLPQKDLKKKKKNPKLGMELMEHLDKSKTQGMRPKRSNFLFP